MNIPASLLAEVRTKRYISIWMKRATHMKSPLLSLTYLLALPRQASTYIYVGGEGNDYIQSNFVESWSRAISGEMHFFKRG